MPNDSIPQRRDLPNKPLLEAVFEVRWALKSEGPLSFDPGFPLFQGRYYDQIKEDFPVAVQLPTSAVPETMTAHTVRQQFRAGKEEWPVTQIGPGILTLNDTSGYLWETYLPQLEKVVKALYEAYPSDVADLKPIQSSLRYINVINFDPTLSSTPLLTFIKDYLHTDIIPEPLLFGEGGTPNSPNGLNLNLAYQVSEKEAMASINIALGQVNDKPALIFEIHVQTLPGKAPQNPENFTSWVTGAHDIVDKWFFALVRGELLKTFEVSDAD